MSHDEIEARHGLLEYWLSSLESGYCEMNNKVEKSLAESSGESVNVPRMVINPPSKDMMDLMKDGLRRAINGDRDPFCICPPRGKKPLLNRVDQIALSMQVLSLKDSGKNEEEAIEMAAESFSVSPSTAKNIFYDRKEWARLTIDAYRNRLIS